MVSSVAVLLCGKRSPNLFRFDFVFYFGCVVVSTASLCNCLLHVAQSTASGAVLVILHF